MYTWIKRMHLLTNTFMYKQPHSAVR